MSTSLDSDDRGTDQLDALRILRNLRERAFESSDEKLALALGRPAEEIETLSRGTAVIDDDLVMKARRIARERGIEIDNQSTRGESDDTASSSYAPEQLETLRN
jgi:hypothetical protein